jgi:hypothetical protein
MMIDTVLRRKASKMQGGADRFHRYRFGKSSLADSPYGGDSDGARLVTSAPSRIMMSCCAMAAFPLCVEGRITWVLVWMAATSSSTSSGPKCGSSGQQVEKMCRPISR